MSACNGCWWSFEEMKNHGDAVMDNLCFVLFTFRDILLFLLLICYIYILL